MPIGSHLPLEGITVVSCEQAVAAPFATRQLADLGARVIKVERPGAGDFARAYDSTVKGMSSHFVWLNRSKESIALDLKDPNDRDLLLALVERADVFVQNLAPGAIERLGLGPAELREQFPGLITCSISGYGTSGPYREAKAYDLLIQSETGLVSVTGSPDEPAKTGIPTADIGAGMYAFAGILSALYQRERTGEGAQLDISLFDSLVEWMGYPLYYTQYGGVAPARSGINHAAIAPYGTYRSGDGVEFVLAVQNDREWVNFCEEVLGRALMSRDPRFVDGSSRVANRGQLDALIEEALRDLSAAQLQARLDAAHIACGRRREVAEVIDHPQIVGRGRQRRVDSPVGPLLATLPVIVFPGKEPRMDAIPEVGEHTDAILRELGRSRVSDLPAVHAAD
ncbi:CaiB/BaiF CoA transferase family protein [Microbacterium sp. 22303]|uniref:CaiB/BaiF CoA transferase family protein n=1 Tax=Microbacterium sp. 22303 TaxID=3453905 RepID=UPI003F87CB00